MRVQAVRARERVAVLAALAALWPFAGCANPAPPKPPSLRLPAMVKDLSAERTGDKVHLRWTTPEKTTDGITIKGPVTAQLCRSVGGSPCTVTVSVPARPGASSEAVDTLPADLRAGAPALLIYHVTLLNSRQRSAGPSGAAFAVAGAAPAAVTDLRVTATERGALVRWQPAASEDTVELDRKRVVMKTVPAPSPSPLPVEKEPEEMRLRVEGTPDAGGSLDATARSGETYTYAAQRVRKVELEGHALEMRGPVSAPVTLLLRDTFPPRPPGGLEAILNQQPLSVDLSWRPDTEIDLAGYLVYRQKIGAAGAPVKLTSAPVGEPGYRDATATAGHSYRYTVTAIDSSGNESAPGVAASVEIPQQ